eukprot:1703383-Pleurochrysis_carterae.AAC.3
MRASVRERSSAPARAPAEAPSIGEGVENNVSPAEPKVGAVNGKFDAATADVITSGKGCVFCAICAPWK